MCPAPSSAKPRVKGRVRRRAPQGPDPAWFQIVRVRHHPAVRPGITCVVGAMGIRNPMWWTRSPGSWGNKGPDRRGGTEDVIFAGTTGRPPLGRAEVSLTIDNSDGALPIEYAEVTITRIMFRNGGSEYQINGDTAGCSTSRNSSPTPVSGVRCTSSSGRASWTPCCTPTRWAAGPSSRKPRVPSTASGRRRDGAGRDGRRPRPCPGPHRRTAPPAQTARPAGRRRRGRRHPGRSARCPAPAPRRRPGDPAGRAARRDRRRGRAEEAQGRGRGRS
ncbi:Chromosome partition protein Smc [Streptomyces badius]